MDALLHDLRFAFRLARKTPLVSVATVLTLALGVGLNAGVFTILDGLLFRARVTSDPASFVHLQPSYSGPGAPREESPQLNTRDYLALRDRTTTVGPLAAWTVAHARFGENATDTLPLLVTCNFFSVYGLDHLERGRTFRDEECEMPAARVAVISDEVWRRYFNADEQILGAPLLLNRQAFTIVGVTPAAFPGRVRGEGIWLPYTNQAALRQGVSLYDDPHVAWLWVEGRLKPGVSRERARAEFNVLMRQQDALDPGRTTTVAVTNGAMIHEPAVAPVAVFVVPLVLGGVGLVLLIACGNVALLLLSRAVTRRREIAVRLAIGCSRLRLAQMLLVESLLLAFAGVPISAWIAWHVPMAMRALIPMMPFYPMQPDAAVFSYLAAVSLAAGAAAGALPIVESLRRRLTAALAGHDALAGGANGRSRGILVAAQVAMSVVLLSGTALLLRVEASLLAVDPTLDAAHVLVANYDPPRSAPPALFADTAARLADLPGVASIAYWSNSAAELGDAGTSLSVRDSELPRRRVIVNAVSPSYFATLNRRIVEGRGLVDEDGRAPARGVVLSEALARDWWPKGGAVGATVETPDRNRLDVVGVVHGDVTLAGASADPNQIYVVAPVSPPAGQLFLRFAGDVPALQTAVRGVLRDLGPASASVPVTLEAADAASAATFMPLIDMVGTLALTAIVLALIGIYGVVAFAVSRRTREIGVRIALGATRGDIMRLILTTGMRPIAVGVGAGFVLVVPAAIALSQVFRRTPVPLRAGDPQPYLAVAALLAVASLLTMVVPARRAAAASPSASLRCD